MRRLIPANVDEDAWRNLRGDFQIDMEVRVKIHKVQKHCCKSCLPFLRHMHACPVVVCVHHVAWQNIERNPLGLPCLPWVKYQDVSKAVSLLQIFFGPRCRFPIQLELLEPAELCDKM